MTIQVNTGLFIAVIIPMFFLGIMGLIQLGQTFGYLRTKDQKRKDTQVEDIYDKMKDMHSHVMKHGGKAKDSFDGVMNLVTQQTGIMSEVLSATKAINGILTSPDYGPRNTHKKLEELQAKCGGSSDSSSVLLGRVETLRKTIKEVEESVSSIKREITSKVSGQLLENTLASIQRVEAVVVRHDASVKNLEELHPKAAFEKGEVPVHWCSATALKSQVGVLKEDVVACIESIKAEMSDLSYAFKRLREREHESTKADLGNMVKVIELLTSVLNRIETVYNHQDKLYQLLTEEEGTEK